MQVKILRLDATVLENQPPVAYLYLSDYSITKGREEEVIIYAYAWDDFTVSSDLTYEVSIKDEDDNSVNGVLSSSQENKGQYSLSVADLSEGRYIIALKVTDADGAFSEVSTTLTVEKSQVPEIYGASVLPNQLTVEELSQTDAITVNFFAWDDDYDTLSATLSLKDADGNLIGEVKSLTEVSYSNSVELSIEGIEQDGDYVVEIQLRDQDNEPVIQQLSFKVVLSTMNTTVTVQ